MEYAIGGILLAAFLYFGYKDDYHRNSKEFIFMLIGVGFFIVGFLILNSVDTLLATVFGALLLGLSHIVKIKFLKKNASSQGIDKE
ncbi:MAG: hypothetical protein P1U56_20970 [Saprospiraceae bacterium]|nr:hypothetical protein [Saprospiraceae bacterium]